MALSDWLNEHLDWEHGEDFDKIEILKNENIEISKDENIEILKDGNSEEPSGKVGEGSHDPDWESLVCKTDRETLADYLVWMAEYVEAHRDGRTLTDNRVRITRNLAKKLRK